MNAFAFAESVSLLMLNNNNNNNNHHDGKDSCQATDANVTKKPAVLPESVSTLSLCEQQCLCINHSSLYS